MAGPATPHDPGHWPLTVLSPWGRWRARRLAVWLIGPLRAAVIADYHRQLATRAAWRRARDTAAGLHTGGAVTYGYQLQPVLTDTEGQLRPGRRLVAHPRTAPVVAAMFTWRVEDLLGDTDITRRLAVNPRRYPAPGADQPRPQQPRIHEPHTTEPGRAQQWRPHQVRAILTHPRYAGRRGAPALVDPDLFDTAQRLAHQAQRRAERLRRTTATNSATINAADRVGGPARPDNARDTP